MSMDGAMSLSVGDMLNYLHFPSAESAGDTVWFAGWVPHAIGGGGGGGGGLGRWGGVAGVCVGLFLLGVGERCVAGVEAVAKREWGRSAQLSRSSAAATRLGLGLGSGTYTPEFILAHDLARGVFHVVRALIGFLFMWTVMTFQAAFILSVVVGVGVGEMVFGRYANPGAHLC